MPSDRGATFAARSDDEVDHGDVANAVAIVHGKRRGPSDAIFGGAGILAHHHFCKFQPVRTAHPNGDQRTAHLCALSNRCNLSYFRAESAVWGLDADT